MMRMCLLTAAFAAATSAAMAQSAEQRYQGTFYIVAASNQCDAGSPAELNRDFLFVFRSQRSKQLIGLFGTPFALSVGPTDGGRFARSGSFDATKIGSGAAVETYSGTYSNFEVIPARLRDDTAAVTVTGVLSNFDDQAGCVITFRAAGARRPDDF